MHVTYYNFLNLGKLKNSCKLQMFFDYLSNETNISIIRLNLIKEYISINVISKTVWKNYAVFEKWLFKIKIEWFLFLEKRWNYTILEFHIRREIRENSNIFFSKKSSLGSLSFFLIHAPPISLRSVSFSAAARRIWAR